MIRSRELSRRRKAEQRRLPGVTAGQMPTRADAAGIENHQEVGLAGELTRGLVRAHPPPELSRRSPPEQPSQGSGPPGPKNRAKPVAQAGSDAPEIPGTLRGRRCRRLAGLSARWPLLVRLRLWHLARSEEQISLDELAHGFARRRPGQDVDDGLGVAQFGPSSHEVRSGKSPGRDQQHLHDRTS